MPTEETAMKGSVQTWLGTEPRHHDELMGRLDARFIGPLMSFSLRRMGDRVEAEDLTQEVFVRLLGAVGAVGAVGGEGGFFAQNLLDDRAYTRPDVIDGNSPRARPRSFGVNAQMNF